MIFLSRVFIRKDGSSFPDKWIPIIYQIITSGSTLNWGELISSNIDLQLKKYQKEHPFFMSSYLLDVMCASIEYPSLGWKWEPNLSSVHVYCKMLWEKRYKENYVLIYNGLFSTLYQVIFGEELMGVKIPPNKGRHFPFCKSQLDSWTFGMEGSMGLWTHCHLSLVGCSWL